MSFAISIYFKYPTEEDIYMIFSNISDKLDLSCAKLRKVQGNFLYPYSMLPKMLFNAYFGGKVVSSA